ncbi:MAG TPA: S41 family peptidase [Polyangiaceae bacterium]
MARSSSKSLRTASLGLGFATAAVLLAGLAARTPLRARDEAALAPLAPPGPSPLDAACDEHRLVKPTGETTGLGCDEVRRVIRQIHARFPAPIAAPEPSQFAEGVANWLDPYGFWSAASEAPSRAVVFANAERLLAELRAPPGGRCDAAREVGVTLAGFMDELRGVYDHAAATAPRISREAAGALGIEPAFEDGQVTKSARELARELGGRMGAIELAYGDALAPYVAAGRERYFPALDGDGWKRLVLAAALRGYIEVTDAHGQWAPLDEEWSLYAGDPSFYDPERLWGDMVRTPLGVRIVDQPSYPLEVDDLVLAVDGVATSGLSFEQVEQLSRVTDAEEPGASARELVILRQGEPAPAALTIEGVPPDAASEADELTGDELDVELVPYGRSYAAVIAVPFIRDDLGERLVEALSELASDGPPEGLLLDLRGNAGGSMDGATSALSLFLPGAPVFSLLHSGRLVEVLHTESAAGERFEGPLAVLVDGETASAAEMIAGALDRYRRAVLLGQPTYGKGCVQEYFHDDAGAGILRLTTRLYTLPDGSAVQRRGLVPAVSLPMSRAVQHEADVPGTLAGIDGPDVRVKLPDAPAWPSPEGRLGPCSDRLVCAALGHAARVPARAFRGDFGPRDKTARRRPDSLRR